MASSHISAAEYLSGESGETYDDEYLGKQLSQVEVISKRFKSPAPTMESQMIFGLSKSSQVMNVLESQEHFDLN